MKERLFALLREYGLRFGDFILASGHKSSVYIDARSVYFRGEGLHLIGELFYQELLNLESQSLVFGASGGMAIGAIPLSCALSLAAFHCGRELPCVVVRKEAKEHGLLAQVEGAKFLAPGTNILLVEDVVTTAASALRARDALVLAGLKVTHVLAIVDREQGGREALSQAGITMNSIFKLSDWQE